MQRTIRGCLLGSMCALMAMWSGWVSVAKAAPASVDARSPTVRPGAKAPAARTKKSKKRTRAGKRAKRTRHKGSKIPPMSRGAALELERWFAPLSQQKGNNVGTRTVTDILRTWIASRWGMQMKRPAWDKWAGIRDALRLWNPAPLYHKMKKQWDKTWVVGRRINNRILFTLPKKANSRPKGIGRAGMGIKLSPLKRMASHKRRPYLFTLSTYADIPPIRIRRLDDLLQAAIRRVGTPQLDVPLTNGQKPLFRDLAKGHSRKVADWLTSRFPITSHLLDRYLHVYHIMTPIGAGQYKMDLRARWRLKPLLRDYPRMAKQIKERHKSRVYVEILFLGKAKRRQQWLKWSYHGSKMEHRFEAVLADGGLMLCNSDWKPATGPWRPTAMGAEWLSHIQFHMKSPQVSVAVSQLMFLWQVKALARGASLSIEMTRAPQFDVKGGEFLRLLARILIPGGVERMARWFLNNLATGNQGRGLKWKWDLLEYPKYARVLLTLAFPMVSSRTLTSILRFLPNVIRQQRNQGKSKARAKARAKVAARKRKRRRRFAPLWRRLYISIHRDIQNAGKILAQR